MPHKAKTDELLGYFPRRCDRCWYRDEDDGTCHGNDPEIVEFEDRYELEWPWTPPDSFCRNYLPRSHAEWDRSDTLPIEAKKKTKKKKKKSRER